MDRRQRKTREAIFDAFTKLLAKKSFDKITVGEIIEKADVGRATFYAHFETKDFLLKELLQELFCHIFDGAEESNREHRHVFECETQLPLFLHLIKHLENNDKGILTLLVSPNNELFMKYFKNGLAGLIEKRTDALGLSASENVPKDYAVKMLASGFFETVKWWVENKKTAKSEETVAYFYKMFGITETPNNVAYNKEDKHFQNVEKQEN